MKKNLLYLFATLITLVLLLAACGAESPAPANSPAENTAPDPVEQPAEENPAAPEPTQAEAAPTGEPTQTVEQPAEEAGISFSAEVFPILESRCLNCHGGERVEGEFLVTSYNDLMTSGESAPVIVPGDASASYLAELLIDQKMPKRGPKLSPVQVQTITDWVNQGALDN